MTEKIKIKLPKTKTGRKSKEQEEKYNQDLEKFSNDLIALEKAMNLPDKVSSRGWCYLIEGLNLIDKTQFDYCQKIINVCRKEGYLPMDFVALDKTREFKNVEDIVNKDYQLPEKYIIKRINSIKWWSYWKSDLTFWITQEYYVQMLVEKIDVFNLFKRKCADYHIPIANAKGWSDLNSRYFLALRFKTAEELGLKPVLMYYGDLDPAGVQIIQNIKDNLKDIEKASKWNPKNLIVDHFGLTYEFIEKNTLTWIDNLKTGSGKDLNNPRHKDHNAPYVQDYIQLYGVRKCEANAILKIRDIAINDCEMHINQYISKNNQQEYQKKVEQEQNAVKDVMKFLKIEEKVIDDLKDKVKEYYTFYKLFFFLKFKLMFNDLLEFLIKRENMIHKIIDFLGITLFWSWIK